MIGLLDHNRSQVRRLRNSSSTRALAWSVLPLRTRDDGDVEWEFDRRSGAASGPKLRLIGEAQAPVEGVASAEVELASAVAPAPEETSGSAEPVGDLVALGTLACLLTMIFTFSSLAAIFSVLF